MGWAGAPPVGKAMRWQGSSGIPPVCGPGPRASGLPLHASSPLHRTPLSLDRLASPGRRTSPVSPGQGAGAPGTEAHVGSDRPRPRLATGAGGRVTDACSLSEPRLPKEPLLETSALTLAWASGWTLSVAMAGAGGLAPHEKRTVHREGKAKAAFATRTAFLGSGGAEVLEGAGPAPERSGRGATAGAGLPLEAERSAASASSTRRSAPARLLLPALLRKPSLSLPASSFPAFRLPAYCHYPHRTHFFPSLSSPRTAWARRFPWSQG